LTCDPMDISIRTLTRNDLETADRIVCSAFDLSESRLAEIARYLALQPDGWFLAAFDGQPAGVLGAVDYGPFAYLGMMTVHKDWQRRGIARTLLQHVLTWAAARGIPLLRLDASAAGYPMYTRFDFVEIDHTLLLQRVNSSRTSGYPSHVQPMGIGDMPAIVASDLPIFGARREKLFRSLLADFPDRCFISRHPDGRPAGYLFAQPERIGPWSAEHPKHAEALLQAALTLSFNGPPAVIAPEMNPEAVALLRRFDFELKLANRHMQRGSTALPGRRLAIYGCSSFAIG
jgi:GNAT superfamily N-acetyltransferase